MKKKKVKVSIITPCFNSESTIRQTIESVLHQTYGNIEYIIVDGASTDGTVKIIREYIPLFHGRLKYISEKDHGIYEAMNKGIKLSTGSIIGIINSDDYYETNAVETVLEHITGDSYQVVYGYCRRIHKNHSVGLIKKGHKGLPQGMIPHPTCFVTRAVYRDLGMFLNVFRVAGDYEFMLRLYCSKKVIFIHTGKIISNYRMGGLSYHNSKQTNRETAIIQYRYRFISLREMLNKIAER